MKIYKADLHLHTILSPCGDYGMTPERIVAKSKEKGLDMIAITDHNSAGNFEAVRTAGEREGLTVIGGMEICSEEEVHLLGYFDRNEDLYNMEMIVQANLPGINNPEAFGDQVFLDSNDKILGVSEKLLFGATSLSIDRIVDLVHLNGGMVVASHVDRESFSILSQLGFIPEGLKLDGIEIINSEMTVDRENVGKPGYLYGYPYISCSDAHYIEDIGKRMTEFSLLEPNVKELILAIHGKNNRGVVR
ncbi:MAG: PHP domain-containing protein [Spirochaetia bacterium]|jgi:PHP family Zn ribbon phosphoesterase|nr:PHP domain-containing protein [Spirochaetia bacterium]